MDRIKEIEELAQIIRLVDLGDTPCAHEYLRGSRKIAIAILDAED